MPTEEEVLKIGKKLEKMIASSTTDHSSAADLLKVLQDIPITLEALQIQKITMGPWILKDFYCKKTRIGMTVNNFRKATTNEEVINLSKSLIKSWKKLLPDSNSKSESKKESKSSEKSEEKMDTKNGEPDSNGESKEGEPAKTEERRSSQAAPDTSDPIRLKCRELLSNALKTDDSKMGMNDPVELGGLIEENIYEEFGNTESKYKNRVRSRVANLRDIKNPALKENVLRGLIPPDRIAKMSAEEKARDGMNVLRELQLNKVGSSGFFEEVNGFGSTQLPIFLCHIGEMASDGMKDLRAKYTKESIDDHQMAKTGGTTTDLFKCGKCGKKNCTYNQVQTRSADEPMTTFVLCNECGNRWKFC